MLRREPCLLGFPVYSTPTLLFFKENYNLKSKIAYLTLSKMPHSKNVEPTSQYISRLYITILVY